MRPNRFALLCKQLDISLICRHDRSLGIDLSKARKFQERGAVLCLRLRPVAKYHAPQRETGCTARGRKAQVNKTLPSTVYFNVLGSGCEVEVSADDPMSKGEHFQ